MRLAPVGRVSGLPRNPPINTFPAALRLLAYNRRVTPAALKKVAGPSQDFLGPHGGRLGSKGASRGLANPPYEKLRP